MRWIERLFAWLEAGFGLCVLFLLHGCRADTRYHVYQTVPDGGGWDKADSLVYRLPERFPSGEYRMEVGLRHTEEYPYRDIWLSVTLHEGDALPPRTDTLHIYLADEQGRWTQGGAAGGLYQHVYVWEKPLVFASDSAVRVFRVTHLMRKNPLPGVSDVGIRLFLSGRINAEENKQQDGESPQ